MINGAALRINSTPPPHNSLSHHSIQIPMLGSLTGPNKPPPGQQQQQQPQLPQQQQGPQTSEIPLPPQSGQDYTLSNVLHFLQTEWRRYERDRNEWEIERAEMRVSSVAVCCQKGHVPHCARPQGPYRTPRRRTSLLRQCEARLDAPH